MRRGQRGAYRGLVEADAAHTPFPAEHFASAFSNSVLEHIPRVQDVLNETARILKPGRAVRVLRAERELHAAALGGTLAGSAWACGGLGSAYRRFFNRISRHAHCDPPGVWETRLRIAGFEIERHWDYFSPAALAALEWGHYFGLPAAICKLLFGRWILAPWRFNLWPTLALVRRYYDEPIPQEQGAYTFYVTRRAAGRARPWPRQAE